MLRRESFQTNYIQISEIQISLQHNSEDNVENRLICFIRVFKVKGLFKMTSRKETPTTFYHTM